MADNMLEFADIDLGEIEGLEIEVIAATVSTGAAEGATSEMGLPNGLRGCSCSCSCSLPSPDERMG